MMGAQPRRAGDPPQAQTGKILLRLGGYNA